MDLVKLGKKGQITIPKAILRETGITEDSPLLVEAASDGSIVLRPAGVYPIEIYTDRQIEAFLDADRLTAEDEIRVAAAVKRSKRRR
jgi:AbrB family looped-hinge helix DNA binding protein